MFQHPGLTLGTAETNWTHVLWASASQLKSVKFYINEIYYRLSISYDTIENNTNVHLKSIHELMDLSTL